MCHYAPIAYTSLCALCTSMHPLHTSIHSYVPLHAHTRHSLAPLCAHSLHIPTYLTCSYVPLQIPMYPYMPLCTLHVSVCPICTHNLYTPKCPYPMHPYISLCTHSLHVSMCLYMLLFEHSDWSRIRASTNQIFGIQVISLRKTLIYFSPNLSLKSI